MIEWDPKYSTNFGVCWEQYFGSCWEHSQRPLIMLAMPQVKILRFAAMDQYLPLTTWRQQSGLEWDQIPGSAINPHPRIGKKTHDKKLGDSSRNWQKSAPALGSYPGNLFPVLLQMAGSSNPVNNTVLSFRKDLLRKRASIFEDSIQYFSN